MTTHPPRTTGRTDLLVLLGTAALVYLLDQASKALVVANLRVPETV